MRPFLAHLQRTWEPKAHHRRTCARTSQLTLFLRWAAERCELADVAALTAKLWAEYVDLRLETGRGPVTINCGLRLLQGMPSYLKEQGRQICRRTLRIGAIKQSAFLPRDLPVDELRKLLREIERKAKAQDPRKRRMGALDRAWVLLMLNCGLRTGEIRRLRLCDLDLADRRARIEQSKGLKDRIVWLSAPTVDALREQQAMRGDVASPDHVFTRRGRPLSVNYCYSWLRTYSKEVRRRDLAPPAASFVCDPVAQRRSTGGDGTGHTGTQTHRYHAAACEAV